MTFIASVQTPSSKCPALALNWAGCHASSGLLSFLQVLPTREEILSAWWTGIFMQLSIKPNKHGSQPFALTKQCWHFLALWNLSRGSSFEVSQWLQMWHSRGGDHSSATLSFPLQAAVASYSEEVQGKWNLIGRGRCSFPRPNQIPLLPILWSWNWYPALLKMKSYIQLSGWSPVWLDINAM